MNRYANLLDAGHVAAQALDAIIKQHEYGARRGRCMQDVLDEEAKPALEIYDEALEKAADWTWQQYVTRFVDVTLRLVGAIYLIQQASGLVTWVGMLYG